MPTPYSNEFQVAVVAGQHNCVPIPDLQPGAELRRLVVHDLTSDEGFTVDLFNRRGAVQGSIDPELKGGLISTITSGAGSKALVTFAAPHGITSETQLQIKDSEHYDGTHDIGSVPSATTVLLATNHSQNVAAPAFATGQTLSTRYPLYDRAAYQLIDPITVADENTTARQAMDLPLDSRDPRPAVPTRPPAGIYLDIQPAGSGAKQFLVAFTAFYR